MNANITALAEKTASDDANDNLRAAVEYLGRGLSVIPLQHASKLPATKWAPYQSTPMTSGEVADTWGRDGQLGVGIVTGAVSGLVVFDVDGPEAEAATVDHELPLTPTVRTSRGWHFYYRHPGAGAVVQNRAGVLPHCDVRGDGGYVVAPPSRHPSGTDYVWVPGRSLTDVPLAPCPAWLLDLLVSRGGHVSPDEPPGEEWFDRVLTGAPQGQRNQTAASLIGHLLAHRVKPSVAAALVRAWNAHKNEPPLPADELDATIQSIAAAELAGRTKAR